VKKSKIKDQTEKIVVNAGFEIDQIKKKARTLISNKSNVK
jgi:hypothetical protein